MRLVGEPFVVREAGPVVAGVAQRREGRAVALTLKRAPARREMVLERASHGCVVVGIGQRIQQRAPCVAEQRARIDEVDVIVRTMFSDAIGDDARAAEEAVRVVSAAANAVLQRFVLSAPAGMAAPKPVLNVTLRPDRPLHLGIAAAPA